MVSDISPPENVCQIWKSSQQEAELTDVCGANSIHLNSPSNLSYKITKKCTDGPREYEIHFSCLNTGNEYRAPLNYVRK